MPQREDSTTYVTVDSVDAAATAFYADVLGREPTVGAGTVGGRAHVAILRDLLGAVFTVSPSTSHG